MSCKQTEKIGMGSPLFMFPMLSVHWLLPSVPNAGWTRCNSSTPASFLLSLQDEDIHDCVLLTDHFLILRNGLQETPVDNADLIWFIHGPLKDEQGHYWLWYVVTSMVDMIEGSFFTWIRTAQQAQLTVLIQAHQLTKDQVPNIYTDNSYAFGVAQSFRMLLRQWDFLIFWEAQKDGK